MGELETGLLEWAGRQSTWQRDVLRRLAADETLSSSDYRKYTDAAERMELQKTACWYSTPDFGEETDFKPIDATHLTATVAGGDPVQIARIVHLEGANDLAPGTALEFNLEGLTIIAGKNGSGKSGYTRILKQVAATRASEQVLPNAFSPGVAPKAIVSYQVGATPPATDLSWESGAGRIESPMQRVRVFDSRSANVHLAGSTEIAYIPAILQVLGEYTNVLQEVAAVIEADAQRERLQNRQWPPLEAGIGLTIFEHFGEQAAFDALNSMTALTEDEETELEGIPTALHDLTSSNPAALAVQARQRAGQLKALARSLEIVADKLTPTNVELSRKLRSDVESARVEVTHARVMFDDADTLPATGDESWQRMWLAAKEFADGEEHEHDFPENFASCPLCAQLLQPDAQARLELFAQFMSGEAQTKLATAQALRTADATALADLPLDSIISQELVDLVGTYDKDVAQSLLPKIGNATDLRDALAAAKADDNTETPNPATLNSALIDIVAKLRAAAATEEVSAEALAATDNSALAVLQLTARRDELTIRKGIVAERDAIGAQHDRAIAAARLDTAKAACSSTSASRKNSELSQSYVTKVCQRFEVEAKTLGLERVPVELVFDRSSRGVSYVKVSLKNAPQIPVASVLSEGEQRVTAIAGFFADLTESGDNSTLVFDDPVSSLDQEFRVKIAQRLLTEAETRQVLVFTHDFAFVQYLYEEKDIDDKRKAAAGLQAAADPDYLHIARSVDGAGVVSSAEVWRHIGVKERIGRLRGRHQSAAVLYRNGDIPAYEKELRDIVGALRDTWEVFVEQELLNNVVTRHQRGVQTQRLSKLTDLAKQDIASVDLGMTVTSRYMTGHAAPGTDGSAPQGPDWLIGEVNTFTMFRDTVLARRR